MGEVRDTSKVNIGSSACEVQHSSGASKASKVNIGSSACEVQHGSGASKASKVNIGSSACEASTEVLLRAKSLGGSWWWSEDMAWESTCEVWKSSSGTLEESCAIWVHRMIRCGEDVPHRSIR